MGLEARGVISPVSSDLQSRVGQSLTSLAALSAEETPGSVWAPSLRVIWAHTTSSLQFRILGTAQQIHLQKPQFGLFHSTESLKLSLWNRVCPRNRIQTVLHAECLISLPDLTVLLSWWNPMVMESILDVIPKFLCSCLICHSVFISVILDVHWHKAGWFLRKRKIQDSANPGRVGSSVPSMGRTWWCLCSSFSPRLHLLQASCLHVTYQGFLSAIHPRSLGKLIGVLWATEGSENPPPARNCTSWTLKINWDSLAGTCLFRKSHTENLTQSTRNELGRSPEVQSQPRCPTSTSQECHGRVCALALRWMHFSSRMAFFPISSPSTPHTRLGALLTALEEPVCLNSLIKEEQRDSFSLLFQQKKRSLSHYLLLGSLCFFN